MKIRLAAVFSDHAVFQRGIAIPVWGWTAPETKVTAVLGDVRAETISTPDGRFLLRLPPFRAGGPYELVVKAAGSTVKVKDILIGEVWVASGQSNMEMDVATCGEQGEETIRKVTGTNVRMLTVPRSARYGRHNDVQAAWKVAGPDTVGNFSAVAFHFADKVQKTLKVPVGILNASWGGTIVETWTSREGLIENPRTRVWTERYEANLHVPGFGVDAAQAFRTQNFPADPGTGNPRDWAGMKCDDSAWPTTDLPRHWQADGHDFSGVFWFRREVTVPEAWAGKDLMLKVGAVDKVDVTYFNGRKVGATGQGFEETHWNVPRKYVVPGKLVKAGRNVIAVRAFSFVHGGGMIGPAEEMKLAPADGSGKAISLAGVWRYRIEHDLGKTALPRQEALPMGPGNPNSPYMLHDNMIAPLIPYAIGGAIWYQGESNAGDPDYCGKITAMIRDWRRAWGQGCFPFLQVQLANYMPKSEYQDGSSWALLREAQFQALAEPATGLAVAIDIGDAVDIHPKNKRDVGYRLAQWALVRFFGQAGVASGPVYSGMTIEGRRIRLRFDNAGRGLVARGGALSHFYIAGPGHRFLPAKAVIEGTSVVVESSKVENPMAVRYAWADNPEGCNFYNRDGFPAIPFRTDSW